MEKIRYVLFFLLLNPINALACSITSSDKAAGGKCVDIGGYQIYARIFGKTEPVTIFDSGLGDDSTVWNAVTHEVSKFSKVVVYDRPGFGKSDAKPGNNPISSQDNLDTLKILLKKQNIKPPYILVGHSRGGLNMQLFAQKHPEEIAGVVLIESASRNQNFHDPAPPENSNYYRESIGFDESRNQVKGSGPFPSVPLIVLTATDHHKSKHEEELWNKWQYEISHLSSKAIQIFAYGSEHYIQKQQPLLVVDAIYTLIKSNNFYNSQV